MSILKPLALAAILSVFAGSASAQVVTVNVGGSWTITLDSGPVASNDFKFLTAPDGGILNINSFCTGGRSTHGAAGMNQAQSNVQASTKATYPLSGSTVASTHSYAAYVWGGAGNGTVSGNAIATPSGVLPKGQAFDMGGSANTTFIMGIYGTTVAVQTTGRAIVTNPSGGPGGNMLLLTTGAPVGGTLALTAFYYSSVANADAQANLGTLQDAFFNTNVFVTATINLF